MSGLWTSIFGCASETDGSEVGQLPSDASGPDRGRLRRRSSQTLDDREVAHAAEAKRVFERKCTSVEEDGMSMSNREHWPAFQAMLKRVAEHSPEGNGELETECDRAMARYTELAGQVVATIKKHAAEPKVEAFLEDCYVHAALKDCAFVGHVATDLDSIAGAIGAAELFGGVATRAEAELNGEIKYVLTEVAKLDEPPLFETLPGCGKPDEKGVFKKVVLVDHNDAKQMVPSLREDKNRMRRIAGLIDHHALSDTFSSEVPLFIDLRPWGSMSSIVAHMYVRASAPLRPEVARLLMCAVLSDTLNLQSVTTTDADRFAVAMLAKLGEVDDPDEVARLMFRAKTKWIVNLGPYSMVRGDQKDFSADGWKYGIAVLEVTEVAPVLEVAHDLIVELRALKIEKGGCSRADELDFAFLFVVDIVRQSSVLLVCGGREHALAKEAFPGCPFRKAHPSIEAPGSTIGADWTLCDVGPLVSRKAQFVPSFAKVLNGGFKCHKERVTSPDYKESADDKALHDVLVGGEAEVVLGHSQEYRRKSKAAHGCIFKGPDPHASS